MVVVLVGSSSGFVRARPSVRDRLRARICTSSLDAALAAGVSPEAEPALALRAQRLVAPESRAGLARWVHSVVARAAQPAKPLDPPLRRAQIRHVASDLEALADRLGASAPVPARGVAKVRSLLSDGGGPLYHRASTRELRDVVHATLDALDPLAAW